jgi:hypothetical protein
MSPVGFLYGGLLVLLLLGIRICRFMRIHLGMKALYLVFVDVARHIMDFAVFATYIMVGYLTSWEQGHMQR